MVLSASPIAYLLDLRPHIFSILTDTSSDFPRLQADDSSNKTHTLPHLVHYMISPIHSRLAWLSSLLALLMRSSLLHLLADTSRSLLGTLTDKRRKSADTLLHTTDQLLCSLGCHCGLP